MMYIVQRENRGERGGRERRRREEEERGGGERRRRSLDITVSRKGQGSLQHSPQLHALRTQCHFLLSASSQLDCKEDMRAALAP